MAAYDGLQFKKRVGLKRFTEIRHEIKHNITIYLCDIINIRLCAAVQRSRTRAENYIELGACCK